MHDRYKGIQRGNHKARVPRNYMCAVHYNDLRCSLVSNHVLACIYIYIYIDPIALYNLKDHWMAEYNVDAVYTMSNVNSAGWYSRLHAYIRPTSFFIAPLSEMSDILCGYLLRPRKSKWLPDRLVFNSTSLTQTFCADLWGLRRVTDSRWSIRNN